MIDLPDGKKLVMLKCAACGVVWKKHYKRIEFIQSTGKGTSTHDKWQASKEFHVCKPKEEIIRKDWE